MIPPASHLQDGVPELIALLDLPAGIDVARPATRHEIQRSVDAASRFIRVQSEIRGHRALLTFGEPVERGEALPDAVLVNTVALKHCQRIDEYGVHARQMRCDCSMLQHV